MNLDFFLFRDLKIPYRKLLANVLLTSITLAFFYVFHALLVTKIFSGFEDENNWIIAGTGFFYFSSIISVIIGAVLSEMFSRRKILLSWITFGFISTALLFFFNSLILSLFSMVLIGISFGLGYPSSLAFLADSTDVTERGRVSGLVIFITFTIVFLSIFISSFLNFEIITLIMLSLFLRSTSFLALLLDPCEKQKKRVQSWTLILKNRKLISYLFPWLIFSIANGLLLFLELGLPQDLDYDSISAIGSVVQYASCGIFALIAGTISDYFGRKQPIIIGLILLGASYTLMGIVVHPVSWFIVLAFSGIAWGFLMVSLAMTAIGDLGTHGSREKMYALASVIPLLGHMSFSTIANLFNLQIPANIISSFLSLILFLSIIPILRAKETLQESKIRGRKMKDYAEKVGKIIQESRK